MGSIKFVNVPRGGSIEGIISKFRPGGIEEAIPKRRADGLCGMERAEPDTINRSKRSGWGEKPKYVEVSYINHG